MASEAGHWYTQDGKPMYTIIGKNGKERNTTLRDARELNLVPSVTTIIGVAAKPALVNWQIDQALLSALTLPRIEGESLDEFKKRAKTDSKEQVIQAANIGTEIHADIERGFQGRRIEKYHATYEIIREWLKENTNAVLWLPEKSFTSPHGYGGKLDLHSDNGVFVDFKSKDGIKDKEPSKLVYEENGMQLSAYAEGLGVVNPKRISCFIDRQYPDVVKFHVWDSESHEQHLNMFLSLLRFWQLKNKV